jgi:hypothetical protein
MSLDKQSIKKLGMSVQKHLNKVSALEEEDMGSSAYNRIKVCFLYGKLNPHSVKPVGLHFPQDVAHHLAVYLFPT